jgi:hypothetical protein
LERVIIGITSFVYYIGGGKVMQGVGFEKFSVGFFLILGWFLGTVVLSKERGTFYGYLKI